MGSAIVGQVNTGTLDGHLNGINRKDFAADISTLNRVLNNVRETLTRNRAQRNKEKITVEQVVTAFIKNFPSTPPHPTLINALINCLRPPRNSGIGTEGYSALAKQYQYKLFDENTQKLVSAGSSSTNNANLFVDVKKATEDLPLAFFSRNEDGRGVERLWFGLTNLDFSTGPKKHAKKFSPIGKALVPQFEKITEEAGKWYTRLCELKQKIQKAKAKLNSGFNDQRLKLAERTINYIDNELMSSVLPLINTEERKTFVEGRIEKVENALTSTNVGLLKTMDEPKKIRFNKELVPKLDDLEKANSDPDKIVALKAYQDLKDQFVRYFASSRSGANKAWQVDQDKKTLVDDYFKYRLELQKLDFTYPNHMLECLKVAANLSDENNRTKRAFARKHNLDRTFLLDYRNKVFGADLKNQFESQFVTRVNTLKMMLNSLTNPSDRPKAIKDLSDLGQFISPDQVADVLQGMKIFFNYQSTLVKNYSTRMSTKQGQEKAPLRRHRTAVNLQVRMNSLHSAVNTLKASLDNFVKGRENVKTHVTRGLTNKVSTLAGLLGKFEAVLFDYTNPERGGLNTLLTNRHSSPMPKGEIAEKLTNVSASVNGYKQELEGLLGGLKTALSPVNGTTQ